MSQHGTERTGRRPVRCARTIALLLACSCLGAACGVWAEECPLELRLKLVSQTVCPMDGIEGTVEFVNRSDHDIVILLPRSNCSGATWIEVVLEGQQMREPRTDPEFGTNATPVVIKPKKSVTSPSLWLRGRGWYLQPCVGKHQVYARYNRKEPCMEYGDAPTPDLLEVCSEPVPLEVRWCEASVPDRCNDIERASELLRTRSSPEEAMALFDRCVADGPACVRRVALEEEFECRKKLDDVEGCLGLARRLWAMADGIPSKETIASMLDMFVEWNGHGAEVAEIVGDYESLHFGLMARQMEVRQHSYESHVKRGELKPKPKDEKK